MSRDHALRQRLSELDELEERPSRFSSALAFWVGRREVAHFEGPGVLDLRLTRQEIRARKADFADDPRVTTRGSSDWVELAFDDDDDLEWIVELVQVVIALETA